MRRTARARGAEDHDTRDAVARVEALVTEVERLRRALDAIPEGVVVCHEDGGVAFRNRAAAVLVEARHADALAAGAVEELLASARAGGAVTRTLELHGPPPRTLVLSAKRLKGDHGPIGTVAVIDDVTTRRQLEAVRRDFVANVSHELRTPVGAISVLAETLADEDDPATIRRLTERIRTEAERVGSIISDLLDLSRIEASGVEGRVPVKIGDVVDAAVERVRPLAEQSEVAVVVHTVPDAKVTGDSRQLVSAVANLLDNAIKYSDPGSEVEITAAVDGSVDLVVRDSGIGIPSRELDRIFERFYRVDRARSRQTGGTGLGLAIVRHIATNHGGDVLVESREGEGSAFTLRLPRAAK